MIKSYLKTAWRNIIKNRTFSIINILGLALGMTCSLLILLWVNDERNMDGFHELKDQLYSIYERQYHDGQIDGGFFTPGVLGEEMKLKFPEVQYATGFAWNELATFEAEGKILKESGNCAGPDFFKMFSFKLIQGDASHAVKTPVDIAISRKMAEDFFGSAEKAFGKTIRYQNKKDLTIAAVFENNPGNASAKFDFILNWETFLENNRWARDWGNNGPSTYLVLRSGTDVPAFREKIKNFIALYYKEENFKIELDVQPYSDRYLHSSFKGGEIVGGRIQYVKLFSIVAVFILLIACINFMNLTTARSVKRSKEIGIRKVVGAVRGALIRQFMGEALWIVMLSFLLALLCVWLLLPAFNSMVQKEILFPYNDPSFWVTLGLITLITGLISGCYPALYLSSFSPVRVFKGSLKFSSSALWFRKGLVVFQFVLSIVLIVGTMIISGQVNYVQSINLGYDKENLIYVPLEGALGEKFDLFKDQSLHLAGVKNVARITQSPTSIDNGTGGVVWEGKDPSSMLQFTQAGIGYDFMKTMNLTLADGRDFSEAFPTDTSGYIVNESAVKIFGYKDPVGMPLTFWNKKGTIVGVVKDFHFNSLHEEIRPLVLRLAYKETYGVALVRTEAGKTKEVLAGLEKLVKELNPQFPFTYNFSDEEYQKLYKSEEIVSKLSNVFALLAIFISCLGLLGLTMFTAEQRTKEIGIRKVLGASMVSLFSLLSKEILFMVGVALIIASPLAWFTMDNWLEEYAYHIDITWWMFLIAGSLAILIALVTVSFQTVRTLLTNPVKSLRTE